MNCPNCNRLIRVGNVCRSCGIDVVLFNKTIKISDVLYNKGLNLAKIRDLSGAQDALLKSIQFNKNNYYARNLLGLVYYESGRMGEALKEWVISASLMSNKNPATKYIERVQNDPKELDLFENAIELYNNALGFIGQKSDDMALIQLKKAIELNPKFIDALNLLAFCYLIQGEKDKTIRLVNKVLALDINNPIALNYYNEINPNKPRPKHTSNNKKEQIQGVQAAKTSASPTTMLNSNNRKTLFGNHFYFAEIISFVVGSLCTLALLFTLVIPGLTREKDNNIKDLQKRVIEIEEDLKQKEFKFNDENARLTDENRELKQKNTNLDSQVALQDKLNKINMASNLLSQGNEKDAASIIYSITPQGLTGEDLSEYERIKQESYSLAAKVYYGEAEAEYQAKNYARAKRSFEQFFLYEDENSDLLDDATFYLGRIAEEEFDFERAKLYYNTIVEKYPGSNSENLALSRLSELE